MLYRSSLHCEISRYLRGIILEGKLEPGQKIPEQMLCGQMKVSRTPLREAVRCLATEGLVILTPHHGAHVKPVDKKDTKYHYDLFLSLLQGLVRSMSENLLRERTMTTAMSGALGEIITTLIVAHNHAFQVEELNTITAFHQMVVSFSDNPPYRGILCQELYHIRQAYSQVPVTERRFQEIIKELQLCAASVAEGNALRLTAELDSHHRKSAEFLLTHL